MSRKFDKSLRYAQIAEFLNRGKNIASIVADALDAMCPDSSKLSTPQEGNS